jgi:pimeloyl-ACP methyl ester carboxylesterase
MSGRTPGDVTRAHNFAAAQNHDALPDDGRSHEPLSSITAPTLVIHGTADPMVPLEHGEALAEAIPDASLVTLERAGHGVDRRDRETVVRAILRHTAHPIELGDDDRRQARPGVARMTSALIPAR